MTWAKFQQKAYDLTEAEMRELIPEITRQYQQAKKEINKLIKEQYVKYLSAVNTDDYYNEMIKYDRLLNLERQITQEYNKYSRQAGKLIEQSSRIGFSNNYYRTAFGSQWLAEKYTVGLLPAGLIELTVLGTKKAWTNITKAIEKRFGQPGAYAPQIGTLSDLLKKNRVNELTKIREALTKGLRRGQAYATTAREISQIIGNVATKDGQKVFSGAMANAMRITQTEGNRVLNDAAFANTNALEAQGFEAEKMWMSALDVKTRATHARLDGVKKKPDDYFRIGDDKALKPLGFSQVKNNVRCRCTTVTLIDGKEPTLRRGRDPVTGKNEVFNYKKFNQWAKEKGLKKNIHGELYK